MAGGAQAAGIPGELPVMGSLVDAGLQNLNYGDSDAVGYFQMRLGIWNTGIYAGYPDHPTLQLQWFINQALAMRQQAIAAGKADYGQDPATWGSWVADVQRPAEQYRGRYQLRLADSQSLIAAACIPTGDRSAPQPGQPAPTDPGAPATPPVPDAQLIPDSVLPTLRVDVRKRQGLARSGALVVGALCANENCFTRANGTIAVPKQGVFHVTSDPRDVRKGKRATFRLPLGRRLQKLVAAAVRSGHCPLAVVRVVAANAGGYRTSASRTVLPATSGRCAGRGRARG